MSATRSQLSCFLVVWTGSRVSSLSANRPRVPALPWGLAVRTLTPAGWGFMWCLRQQCLWASLPLLL